ncbi:MAG: methyltransferase domain-containing protein [Sedimentisphaerales bacterium]|nr:methyltransferase domain-containing protein [Sedimentisphaerales bacterium]
MRIEKVSSRFLVTTILILTVCEMSSCVAADNRPGDPIAKPANRDDSVRTLVRHLGLGQGSVIADIGAGRGRDTWVFAEITGTTGTVFAEEIQENAVNTLRAEAEKRGLSQVKPVLGRSDNPCLPADTSDLVYMNHVYHHFAKPRQMLRAIWRSLKPGGYLTIVDRERGTLRNWVERSRRETKHFWIAETTVVREAREEGFIFVECAEPYWHTKDDFVLVFQRPKTLSEPGRDPDAFAPINVKECSRLFKLDGHRYQRPVFIAVGQAREIIAPILEYSSGEGMEIVLEEWATQKNERQPLPPGISMPSVLTQQGDPNLPDEPIDAIFFLDSYHLLFHGPTLLAKLHEKLLPTGCITILDRKATKPLSRREASHRRMIEPETVIQEMTQAGFHLWSENPRPAPNLFLLVFGKTPAEKQPESHAGFIIKDGKPLFPIGCYELPKDDAELERMAKAGMNLVRCRDRSDLDRVASVGMLGWIVIPMQQGASDAVREKIESVVTHPALAIWEGPDEVVHNFTAWSGLYRTKKIYKSPDAWRKQSPEAVAYSEEQAQQIIPKLHDAANLIRTLDNSNRQIWINEAAQSDLKFVRQYIDHIDITGCDIYPVKTDSQNVAIVGDATERWKKVGRNEKPVWMVLQAFSWSELGDYYGHKTVAYPSFAESRFMAYDAIVHGARGLLYWGSHYLKSSEFRQSLYALASELAGLQPFLVADEYPQARVAVVELEPDPSARGVRVSVRQSGREWIVILVNEDDDSYLGVDVTGLDELNGRTLELLYGSEKVTVNRGELITRIKSLEVKVFATSRRYETELREGRDYSK